MADFFKKSLRKDTRVAVCTDDHSISIARIRIEKDFPPVLELCDVQEIQNFSLRDAELIRLTEDHGLNQYDCLSSLSLGEYNLFLINVPETEDENLLDAVRFRIKDLINYPLNDAVIDFFEMPSDSTKNKSRRMYAVVAKKDRVNQHIKLLQQAGLNLNTIDIPELALRNVTSMLYEDVAGLVFVYIGEHQSLVMITKQSTLYLSRSINIGRSTLPESILSVMDDEECQEWLNKIVIEIRQSLDYYESHYKESPISSVVLTPIGREVPGISEYIADQLQMKVRIINVNELIDTSENLSSSVQSGCLIAIGTALRQETASI